MFGQIDLVSIELQKVYRQTDSKFIHVLDHIRNNTVGSTELQLLNTRYGTQIEQSEADMYITSPPAVIMWTTSTTRNWRNFPVTRSPSTAKSWETFLKAASHLAGTGTETGRTNHLHQE